MAGHLRVGELKSMLALAGGDLDQALAWTEWTIEYNQSVFSPERVNCYRCLQTYYSCLRKRIISRCNISMRSCVCTVPTLLKPPAPH